MAEIERLDLVSDLTDFDSVSEGSTSTFTWSSSADLNGTGGGAALFIDANTLTYGQEAFTWSTDNLGIGIWFDPNGLTMASADEWRLVRVYDGSASNERCQIFVGYDGASYYVKGSYFDDADSETKTLAYTFDDNPHHFEINMQRATSDVASNGSLRLWLDGSLKETKSALDIFDIGIPDVFRAGNAGSMDTGTRGTCYLTEIVLRDDDTRIYDPVSSGVDVVLVDHHLRQLANN